MFEYANLLSIAQKRFEKIDLHAIHCQGIRKRCKMFTSSSIQVAYPPLAILQPTHDAVPSLQSRKKYASLYVHIPFCRSICSYCGFARYQIPQSSEKAKEFFDDYLALLSRELSLLLRSSVSSIGSQEISSVYFGGGTPTILGPEHLTQLITTLRLRLNIPRWAEITVEASPETISDETVQALHESGCNRLSIGVQTFDDDLLQQIGRKHTRIEAVSAVEKVRRAGIENINIDFIRNLPGQDTNSLINDLSHVESLQLPSVTIYHLIVKPLTRFARLYHQHPEVFPSEQDALLNHLFILEGMTALGYTQWPVDWFLLDRNMGHCVHQELKWLYDTDLIGIGCSAYSFNNNVQYYNHRSLADYGRALQNGELPIAAAKELDVQEQFHRRVIFSLRYEVDCQRLFDETGFSVEEVFRPQIDRLGHAGLVSFEENTLRLTSVGKLFADEVMGEFFSEKVRSHVVAAVKER